MADRIIQIEDVHTLMDDQAQAGSTKERRVQEKLYQEVYFSMVWKNEVVFWLTVMYKEVCRGRKLSE